MKIRIYYDDTDAGGVVYHANYLKFCERGRSQLFYDAGLQPWDEETNSHFVVSRVEADFLHSAKLGDEISVTTEIEEMGRASFVLIQRIYRVLDGELLFKARVRIGMVHEGRPVRIPKKMEAFLRTLPVYTAM